MTVVLVELAVTWASAFIVGAVVITGAVVAFFRDPT